MPTTTCEGVAVTAGREGGPEPVAGRRCSGNVVAQVGEERRQRLGVQEWPDGSKYDGEFVNGLKHGKGRYSWKNGEYYEGSFYKDYKHGDGLYCWATGHKFIGKFYLNRKEGYGQQIFPDGATFQGLYHSDQRFGPGVVTYPDGRQDVGLWLRERLLRLCTPVEEGFSLNNFPEYAAYMEPSASTDFLAQPQSPSSGLHTKNRTDFKVNIDGDLLSDESFIIPNGIERYSTDGDHLPLPPGRRRELDQHFYGELWEPEAHPHQGYERDPLSTLHLQARMQAHIHKNRLQAENVGWDVAAVLSLNREGFGPKGPLEVSSELMIQHSSRGELQAVSQILQTGSVHPDVADSRGHTALIAATVNCHNDVIHMLLDRGADIDKLSGEGMSALAVCHVLYYPFQSLHLALTEPPTKTPTLLLPPSCGNSHQISQDDLTSIGPILNNGPHTSDTTERNRSNFSHRSEQTSKELNEHNLHQDSKVSHHSELTTGCGLCLYEPETPAGTEHSGEEEGKEKVGVDEDCQDTEKMEEEQSIREDEKKSKCDERQVDSRCNQARENAESQDTDVKRELKKDVELVDNRKESKNENMVREEKVEKNLKDTTEREERRGSEDVASLEHSIHTHSALGSVQWKETGVKRIDKEPTTKQTFDSACSVSSYDVQVSEEVMPCSAEAPSGTKTAHRCDTRATVSKVATVKTDVRLKTLKLLLERGADPNMARVPMPVLFLAIMAADTEAVKRLLLCGARTDVPLPPEKRGLYPLHVAAELPGPTAPRITELLLHTATDSDARACDQDKIYEPDKETPGTSDGPHLKVGGRTALHVACQRDNDHQNASEVVALLLSHRASTDLLWSGHSPLSLAIASGNDLAVEELLNGGADPNLQLGFRVGSALCALLNINYRSSGDRVKLLDMLAKAGADVSMPVTVGDAVGNAVDYAHYSFSQDILMAHAPSKARNKRKREARQQLLSMMRDLLRQTTGQRERDNLERRHLLTSNRTEAISSNGLLPSCDGMSEKTENHRKEEFKFCYHCGRSVFVKLTACSRCHKVFYCSKVCKRKAWDERHKEECIRVSNRKKSLSPQQLQPSKPKQHQPLKLSPEVSADGIPKSVAFNSQRTPRPLTIMKPKTSPPLLSVTLKSQRAAKPSRMPEKPLENQVNLKENYSYN
ncbi:ankyrin repeat and MYND domain-containing protein 1 isoform 2-T2 [Odontesthes bonariensis]|uniref:ankyrin repeat and MYND domain-containing protein 1 isoform X2 n=1 Tax=Odontesthes bonariensis TaxID=219752 RepID=UPI003F58A4AC